MYSNKKLVILDADGTLVDAFSAIASTFEMHDMNLGDLQRFQKRHNLLKYLGGVKEFPRNLKRQLKKIDRKKLIETLTMVYREEAQLYPGMAEMIKELMETEDIIVGIVTRNITLDPNLTISSLLQREGIEMSQIDFLEHIPLKQKKTQTFRRLREELNINPALCYVCGDENKDYLSAIACGMNAFIASYGFESYVRLTEKFEIPAELISPDPISLKQRLFHSLQLHMV